MTFRSAADIYRRLIGFGHWTAGPPYSQWETRPPVQRGIRAITQYGAYIGLRIVICVIQALPLETCDRCARGLAWLFTRVVPIRRKVIAQNLQIAFPEANNQQRSAIARRMWHHLFLLIIEVAHAPRKIHETNWRDYIQLGNVRPLMLALLDERPLVLVSGHYGNFELGGYVLGLLGFPTSTVARVLDNPHLEAFVGRFRGATGQRIIPKKGGYELILEVLSNSGTMVLLADQHAGQKGCWVDFFGREASAHKAIALLSLEHDAPMIMAYTQRRAERPLQFTFGVTGAADPLDPATAQAGVKQLTQWYTHELEGVIRSDPGQYWWLHRRWRERERRPGKAARKAAA